MDDKELIKGGIDINLYVPEQIFPVETVIEQIMREKDKEINGFRNALGLTPPVERKRQLMRLEKEMLVDMVFNLENKNETLVNNLIEVEKMYNKLKETEIVKHGHLIDLPRALNPSERPVKCSVCGTVTSLYHGYKPRYCSNCGAKFDEEEKDK